MTALRVHPTTHVAAYLADLANPAIVPVLDSDTYNLVAGLFAPVAPSPEVPGLVVAVGADSKSRPVAQALATRLGGRVTSLPLTDDVASSAEHVLVVGLSGDLTVEDVVATVDVAAASSPSPGLGFATGLDLGHLSWLLAKGIASQGRVAPTRQHVALTPFTDVPALSVPFLGLSGPRVNRVAVRAAVVEDSVRFLSVTSSGREHGILLGDTVLCGSDPAARRRGASAGIPAPPCAHAPTCFIDGITVDTVIEARTVRAEVVLTNSCLSWRPVSGVAPADFLLTTGLSSGEAAAVIGAVFPSHAAPWTVETFHRLGDEGVPLGRIVGELNRLAAETLEEMRYFVLQGLPWLVPGRAEPGKVRAEPRPAVGVEAVAAAVDPMPTPAQNLDTLRSLGIAGPVSDAAATDTAGTEDSESLLAEAGLAAAGEIMDFCSVTYSGYYAMWEPEATTSVAVSATPCPYCGSIVSDMLGGHPDQPWRDRQAGVCWRCGPVWDMPQRPVLRLPLLDIPPRWPTGSRTTLRGVVSPGPAGWPANRVVTGWVVQGQVHIGIDLPGAGQVHEVTKGGLDELVCTVVADIPEDASTYQQDFCQFVVVSGGAVHLGGRGFALIRTNK